MGLYSFILFKFTLKESTMAVVEQTVINALRSLEARTIFAMIFTKILSFNQPKKHNWKMTV